MNIGSDQNRPNEEHRPNDRFVIRKRPLAKDDMNGRSWPKAAVALKPSRMSELGQHETFPALSRMSAAGGKAELNGAKADIGQRMSVIGGGADVARRWSELLLLAITGHVPQRQVLLS